MAARAPEPDRKAAKPTVRISRISIQNYKAIESLELDLPPPKTEDEPDAFVLGSKNGVGKTSVLEACALGVLSSLVLSLEPQSSVGLPRSGAAWGMVNAIIRYGQRDYRSDVQFGPWGMKPSAAGLADAHDLEAAIFGIPSPRSRIDAWLPYLLGIESDPLIAPRLLFFHSYRKVREGNLAVDVMVNANRSSSSGTSERNTGSGVLGLFKALLVQALMARSGLFEGASTDADSILDKLNGLMRDFAQGSVDKLRPAADGTLELRVVPVKGGPSYGFDGLSSGQKEIIATLFLIWHYTRKAPGVVLIDEPELHLNAEWQRLFVSTLWSLAPWNQYIMATHSEEVFGSVTEDRRLLLQG
jgi:hypothetical protein